MSNKVDWNVFVPGDEYVVDNKTKHKWKQVGVAFENNGTSINIKIDNNISVSNELVLFKPKPKQK